ncbi:MAG: glycosyl transferase family 1, partial [Actinomycetota bacterium]|nr:glycosyl transferase family 1 [Actinomycetota bacterium]
MIHAPVFGGAHNQLLQLHAPLAREGIELIAVLPEEGEEAAARLEAGGVKVHRVRLGRLRASANAPLQARFARGLRGDIRRLRALIAAEGAAVVQCHGITNPQGGIAARREGAAVLWQLFDTRAPMAMRR